jgi:two-component system, cell cycle sensor histidine kinase and response regulator CckA
MDLSTQPLSFSGHRWGEPEVVDLRTLVSGMDLGRYFSGDTVFCTDFTTVTCPVRVDSLPLEEVVVGLVLNAREAVGHSGTVLVRIDHFAGRCIARRNGTGWVMLEMSDSGRRMDKETLGRVFHSPFRTRPFPQSRGLALSVACGIVRRSGGTLKVSSVSGCGMTVRVWLPAVTLR